MLRKMERVKEGRGGGGALMVGTKSCKVTRLI